MSEQKKVGRRRFLAITGSVLGAGLLSCGGLTVAGLHQPAVEYAKNSYGAGDKMNKKVLVAYASRAGSTSDVADAIGKTLSENGISADVRLIQEVDNIGAYDAAIVGSAIYMGRWISAATKFVEKNQVALNKLPVAYFAVCQTMREDTEENRRTVSAYLEAERQLLKPADEAYFAGALNFGKLPFLYRLIAKGMKQTEGDWRNWNAIGLWAAKIPAMLSLV